MNLFVKIDLNCQNRIQEIFSVVHLRLKKQPSV